MEAVGVHAASSRSKVEWIVIKSICDWADGNKHKKAQPLAAKNAAEFIKMMLSEPGLDQLQRANSENHNSNSLKKALDQSSSLSQNFVLETLINNIRDANKVRHQTGESLREFLGSYFDENGNLKIPNNMKDYVDTLVKSHNDAIEHWLNKYNDGCAKYLSSSINQYEFETLLREEIVELFEVDGPHRKRLYPQNASSYKALWKVYEKFKDQ